MPWDNLCYCLLEAAWRTVADLVLYLCLLKSVYSGNKASGLATLPESPFPQACGFVIGSGASARFLESVLLKEIRKNGCTIITPEPEGFRRPK